MQRHSQNHDSVFQSIIFLHVFYIFFKNQEFKKAPFLKIDMHNLRFKQFYYSNCFTLIRDFFFFFFFLEKLLKNIYIYRNKQIFNCLEIYDIYF